MSVCTNYMENKRTLLQKCLNISVRNQQSKQIQYYQSPVRDENMWFNSNCPKYHPLSSSKKKYKNTLNIKPISLKDSSINKQKRYRQYKKNNEKMMKQQQIPVKNQKIRKASINLQDDILNNKVHTEGTSLFKNSLFQQLVSFFRKTLQKQCIYQKQIQQIVNSSYFINELKFISSIYTNSNIFKQKNDQIGIHCINQSQSITTKSNSNPFCHKNLSLQSQLVKLRQQFKNLFSLFKKKQQQLNRILQSHDYYHQKFKRTDIENKRIFQALQQMKHKEKQSQINFNKKMEEMNELLYQKICEIQNQKCMRNNLEQQILEMSDTMHKKDFEILKWKSRYRDIAQFVDKQVLITKFEYKEQQIYQQSKRGFNLYDQENCLNSQKISGNVEINNTCQQTKK